MFLTEEQEDFSLELVSVASRITRLEAEIKLVEQEATDNLSKLRFRLSEEEKRFRRMQEKLERCC